MQVWGFGRRLLVDCEHRALVGQLGLNEKREPIWLAYKQRAIPGNSNNG